MPIIALSSLSRGIFGTEYGMGENFSDRRGKKGLKSLLGMDYLAGGITFDLITEEEHKLENDVTSHPVEEGAEITDHIRNKLRTGRVTGLVSNFSLFAAPFSNVSLSDTSLLGESTGTSRKDRIQKAYEFIRELWKRRVLVDIVTVLEVYKNVAITEIDISRDGETGDAQSFTISFQEMSIKKLNLVTSTISVNVKRDMSQNIGKQTSQPVDAGLTTTTGAEPFA